MKRKILSVVVSLALLVGLMAVPASAATPEEIEASIDLGITWLASQQQPGGSWSPGNEPTALTGFALVKLCDRAYETGYSPFDPGYDYSEEVEKGLDYLFGQASAAGVGIRFAAGWTENYSTGIAMMAIASTRDPDRVVGVANPAVNGKTYKQVLQGCVDYMAWAQCDAPAAERGGWSYGPNADWADQSNTGYSVLGLRYAEEDLYGFECSIPQVVRDELKLWVNYIQLTDGGSDYDGTWGSSNLLRTGNLLFEQSFVGIPEGDLRVQDALGFIETNWVGGTDSQTMYCLMKGLESYGIETITVGGDPDYDWFDVFADHIIANQHADGYWDNLGWGQMLDTVWALLTLEKIAPPPPNQPPVADAGPDQTVEQASYQGTDVTLDGSGSYDPDEDPITYLWTWEGGSSTQVGPTVTVQLGTTTFTLVVNDGVLDSKPDTVDITVVDTTAPVVRCVESVNPNGNNVPGKNRGNNGKPKGVNPDGFYQLFAKDACDPDLEIRVGCRGCAGQYPGTLPFGPFPSGIVIKFTEAPGATPSIKKIGSPAQGGATAVTWHITLPSEPVVFATDASGNIAFFPCFVPPPPK